jgi:hypothetical protein
LCLDLVRISLKTRDRKVPSHDFKNLNVQLPQVSCLVHKICAE